MFSLVFNILIVLSYKSELSVKSQQKEQTYNVCPTSMRYLNSAHLLQRTLTENTALRSKIEKLSKQIRHIESSNEELLGELKSLTAILTEKEEYISQLNNKLLIISEERGVKEEQTETELEDLRENIASLKNELLEERKRIENQEILYNDYKHKARKVLEEKDDVINQFMTRSRDINIIPSSDSSNDDLIAEITASKKYIKQIKLDKEALQSQLKESEDTTLTLKQKISKLQNELDKEEERYQNVIKKKEEECSEQKRIIASLERKASLLNQSVEQSMKTIHELECSKSSLEAHISDLKQRLANATKVTHKVPHDVLDKIRILEQQLITKQSQIDVLMLDRRVEVPSYDASLPMPSTSQERRTRLRSNQFSMDELITKLASLLPKSKGAKAGLIVYLATIHLWTLYILFFSMNSIKSCPE